MLGHSLRIRAGHTIVLLAFVPTILLTFIDTDAFQLAFFCISMLLASLASFGSIGLIACGLLGFSAKFPSENVQAVMIGQSVAGILSSLLSIVCQIFFYELLIRSNESESLLVVENIWIDQSSDQRLLDSVDSNFEADESPLHLRSVEAHSLWNDVEQTKMEWWAGFIVFFGTMTAFSSNIIVGSNNCQKYSLENKIRAELRELTGSIFGFMAVISTFCGSLIGLLLVKYNGSNEKRMGVYDDISMQKVDRTPSIAQYVLITFRTL
ncbi:BMA-ENT-7 [Dirofilaria immitis]|nr:BMA-ENT-7 [Dirofilaria immitis]